MKLWNMHRIDQTHGNDDDDDDDSAEDDNDAYDDYNTQDTANRKPKLNVASVPHSGAINRLVYKLIFYLNRMRLLDRVTDLWGF